MDRFAATLISTMLVVAGASCGDSTPEVDPPSGAPPATSATGAAPRSPAEPTSSPVPIAAPDPVTDEDRLRLDGIGGVTVGMSVDEAEQATGQTIRIFEEFSDRCRHAELSGGPREHALMLSYGRIVRVEFWGETRVRTLSGIGVGSSEDDVKSTYGSRITQEPHPYLGNRGSYLVYTPESETDLLLIFETDRGKVTSLRSGYEQQVRYPEGCA